MVINSISGGGIKTTSGKAILYLKKDGGAAGLRAGDSVLVPGNWQPVKNAGNPFEFDYAAYCRRNNVFYTQYCTAEDVRLFSTHDPAADGLAERSHNWCMAQLDRYIGNREAKGLVQAMLIGDEVNLDEELRQSYSDTGIIHIIAISGGNVAIFFFVISFLLRWLKHKKHLWVRYLIALPLVWFYIVMAGSSPSAMRAAVMFSLLAFGIILRRDNNSLNLLFATSFVLLCAQPQWLFALGFQLSFVAVLSILLFYGPVCRWVATDNKAVRIIWQTVAASIAAELLVAPLVIGYFHMFPLLFIVANVAAFMFMNIVLVLGISILALAWLPYVPGILGTITEKLIQWFDYIVTCLQHCNSESFRYLMLSNTGLVLVYICITGIAVFLLYKNKPALFTGLAGLCVLLFLLCNNEWVRSHQRKLVLYSTGKTNHIELIQGSRYSIVQTDSGITAKSMQYVTTEGHTAWGAWKKGNEPVQDVYRIGGKTALILNEETSVGGSFPVDYLVVNCAEIPDPAWLRETFGPATVVLGNRYQQQDQDVFIKQAGHVGLGIYSVRASGAFVLDGQ